MARLVIMLCILLYSEVLVAQKISSDIIEAKLIYFSNVGDADSVFHYTNIATKDELFTNEALLAVGGFYLKQQQYAKALNYFEKSLQNNHYNPLLHYYLNICYSNLGMYDQQHFISKYYNEKQIEYYQYKKNKLENISFYSGGLISNNLSKNANMDITNGNRFYSRVDRTGSLYFNYLSLQYRFKSRFTLIGSLNYNLINGNQQFNYEYFLHTPPHKGDTAYSILHKNFKVMQPITYIQLAYVLSKDIKVKFAYAVTNTAYSLLNPTPMEVHNNQFRNEQTTKLECTVGLMLQYRKPHYQVDVRGFVMPFSPLNFAPLLMRSDSDRTQLDAAFTYFPLQKNTLSIKVQGSWSNTQNSYAKLIYSYEINAQIIKKLWVNLQYQHNNLKNFIDMEGAVVYNIDDVIHSKLAARFIYYLNKHIELSIQYGFMNRTGNYKYIVRAGSPQYQNEYRYNNQILNGGLKWNF